MLSSIALVLFGTGAGTLGALRVRRGYLTLRRERTCWRADETESPTPSGPHDAAPSVAPSLIVLLPVFHGQEQTREAFEWFSDLEHEEGAVAFVLATTARDSEGADYQACRELALGSPDWFHVHSTRVPFCKASQLNEAVSWSVGRWPSSSLRFAVYDIDGRPESLPLRGADAGFDIEQQLPVPGRPVTESRSMVGRGHAGVQAVRVFGHEYRGWWRSQKCRGADLLQGRPLTPAFYCWGNGLVITSGALSRIGGFPVPVDDAEVGYEALVAGLTARIRPEVVWHTAYADPRDMVRSLGVVLAGDAPLGHSRWRRAGRAQRSRLLVTQVRKVTLLLEPLLWVAAAIVTRGDLWTLVACATRYVAPTVAGWIALRLLIMDPGRPIPLAAPRLVESIAASLATPLIRLFAWLRTVSRALR